MRAFAATLALLTSTLVRAADGDAPPAPPPQPPAGQAESQTQPAAAASVEPMLEATRESVRSTTEWLARGVDGWFGDKSFADSGKVRDGVLSVFLLTRQHESPDLSVRFNARVWLPNLQDRAYIFLGRDDLREAVVDQPSALSRQQGLLRDNNTDPSFFAGLGLRLDDSLQVRVGFHGGLKPYAHVRYARAWRPSDIDLVDFRETVFWALDDHFGSTTALSYEHAFTPALALRWLTSTTITQESRKFDWSSSLGTYRSYGGQRLLSLEFLLRGLQGSGVGVTDIGVQAKWAQPVLREWLLGEVLLGHFWPRPDALSERTRAWAIGAGLRMRF